MHVPVTGLWLDEETNEFETLKLYGSLLPNRFANRRPNPDLLLFFFPDYKVQITLAHWIFTHTAKQPCVLPYVT
jgi:hypothetical protein